MSPANEFPQDENEMLPDGVSLLLPHERAAVAARRAAPPASAFEAILRASVPAEGDPPVPLVEDTTATPTQQSLPAEMSLLTPAQRLELAARRTAR